jgi:non-ribosomal peptide synthase protein (TIGR01720 family)
VLLEVPPGLSTRLLRDATGAILLHHDALRLRVERLGSTWRQEIAEPTTDVPFSSTDLAALAEAERKAGVEAKAEELQANFDLASGPLLRVAHFDFGPSERARLLVLAHHLVVDGVSWRILLEDLATAYWQLARGERVRLPAKTTSFKQWAERLVEHARSAALQEEAAAWQRLVTPGDPLPRDDPEGVNTLASARTLTVSLDGDETHALLLDVGRTYRAEMNDVLLTALVQACAGWAGTEALRVDLEGHGREPLLDGVDVSRTVGWFTSIFPVTLSAPAGASPAEALQAVKEQLRRVPRRGIGYGLLRYLSHDPSVRQALGALPLADVGFNYFGQLSRADGSSWAAAAGGEGAGRHVAPVGERRALIELDARVEGGCLRAEWTYSQNIHARGTVEGLAQDFVEALRALVAAARTAETPSYSPADFEKARLSESDLSSLLEQLRRPRRASER